MKPSYPVVVKGPSDLAFPVFSSGQLLYNVGWSAVNLGALPLVLLTLAATAWLWWKSPKPGPLPAETPIEAAAK